MKIQCMIVDDEPLAQKVLEKYIHSFPSLELASKCRNAIEASAYLHENTVDLIFLDIEMPGLTGMEFLKTMSNPPLVIITTAYSEYALEGYEYAVVDYLLKPIAYDRFLKAINRVHERFKGKRPESPVTRKKDRDDVVFLKCDNVEHKIKLSDIKYIEGYGNFVNVHTQKKVILISEKMKTIEENLSGTDFIRVHKSYIVSLLRIDRIEGNKIHIQEDVIPIGRFYKRAFDSIVKLHQLSAEKSEDESS